MSQGNIIEVWNDILKILEEEISESTFRSWIVPLEPQYIDDSSIVVYTGQALAPHILRSHYATLSGAAKKVIGKDLEFKIIFDEELEKTHSKNTAKRIAQLEKESVENDGQSQGLKYKYKYAQKP